MSITRSSRHRVSTRGARHLLLPSLLLIGLAILPLPAFTQVNDYQQGIAAFKQGHYQQALEYFLAHHAQGHSSPTLLYNLGVCHYKLHHFPAARQQFTALLDHPDWMDLARYNLGLVADKTSDTTRADHWYQLVAQSARNETLRRLAARQLEPATAATAGPAYASASIRYGYDNNPYGLNDALESRATSDHYLDLLLFGHYRVDNALSVDGTGFSRRYREFDNLDLDTLNLGLNYQLENTQLNSTLFGDVTNRLLQVGAGATVINIGGDAYTREVNASLEIRYNGEHSRYRIIYEPAMINGANEYDYLDGTRHRLTLAWQQAIATVTAHAWYRFTLDDRADLETDTVAIIQSQQRHTVGLGLTWHYHPRLQGFAKARYYQSKYKAPSHLIDLDGREKRAVREPESYRLELGATYQIDRHFDITVKAGRENTDDVFIIYSHDRTFYDLELQYDF